MLRVRVAMRVSLVGLRSDGGGRYTDLQVAKRMELQRKRRNVSRRMTAHKQREKT